MYVETEIDGDKIKLPITQSGEFIMTKEYFIPYYEKFELQDYCTEICTEIDSLDIQYYARNYNYLKNQKIINDYSSIVRIIRENCSDKICENILLHLKNLLRTNIDNNLEIVYIVKIVEDNCSDIILEYILSHLENLRTNIF